MRIELTDYQQNQLKKLSGYQYENAKARYYKENTDEAVRTIRRNEARFTNVMLAKLICFFLFKLYKQMGGKDTFEEVYNEAIVETN